MRTCRTFWPVLMLFMYGLVITCRGKMFPGTITFKQKWPGVRPLPVPGSSQYNVMAINIENAIQRIYQEDPTFEDVKITQIRVETANKTSSTKGQLAADFQLFFTNVSDYQQSRGELQKLFSAVRDGDLEGFPIETNSLRIGGMSKIPYEIPITETQWPSGNYGLPKPKSGCPSNEWGEGYRYHDSENYRNGNYQSNRSHLAGEVNDHGIAQRFCMHHEKFTAENILWPWGQYCIYKKGTRCPKGLEEGWVRWDDENSDIDFPNTFRGDVPEGIYGENTVVYFCCSKTGSKSTPIHLPYGPPFYLLAFGSPKCQQVHNYEVSQEFVQFDDEDQGNLNAYSRVTPYGPTEDPYNTRIYYCHYKPVPCEKIPSRPCPRRSSGIELVVRHKKITMPDNKESSRGSAFATGSGIGVMLFGVAVFAITTKRFLSFYEAAKGNARWS